MQSFKWGPQFVTGIDDVDDQHQSLVTLINNFGEAVADNNISEDLLSSSFQAVAEYAQTHFATEEKLMYEMQLDPRHIKSHLYQHNIFVNDILDLMDSIDTKNQDDCRSLFEYLVHWLAYHILGVDKNLARQLSSIKNGKSPAEAYEKEEKETSSSTEPLLSALKGLFSIVSKRNKDLSDLNKNLEDRVTQRTAELLKANEKLEIISVTDDLTQLPNRRFAMSQLKLLFEEAAKQNHPLSCLMVDADNFKVINDTHGHDAGDVVLQRLAKELHHCVRSDDIVCRLGGDEFFIICPNTKLEGAMHLGEQTRTRVAAMKVAAGSGFWLGSVSIGAACITPQIKDIDSLIKIADEAVYIAKKDGRNCVRSK